MNRRFTLFSLLGLGALVALPTWAIPIEIDDINCFMSQSGVRPANRTTRLDEGQTIAAIVSLPAVLARHGLKAAKEGEAVELTYLGNNRFKLMHVPSGRSVEITYRPQK